MSRPADKVAAPVGLRVRDGFAQFFGTEVAGAVVLLAAAIVALIIANSPMNAAVQAVWNTDAGFALGKFAFSQSLLHWVDDGLMALFFFVVGLEVKREMLVGELSAPRKAMLPILAALGGMVVPAAIYFALNAGGTGARGWGIPMATDIAFALGVMALLGSRVPAGIKVFLAALAIADDIGAILVIAIFYASEFAGVWLLVAAVLLGVLIALNKLGVDSPGPYFVIGGLLWFAVLLSGVHATIAGVLIAMTIPTTAKLDPLRSPAVHAVVLTTSKQSTSTACTCWPTIGSSVPRATSAEPHVAPRRPCSVSSLFCSRSRPSWCCRCSRWVTPACGSPVGLRPTCSHRLWRSGWCLVW